MRHRVPRKIRFEVLPLGSTISRMAYKRSIFLINRPFQLRFSFYVCSWLFALSLIYPWFIQSLFGAFVRYVTLDPMGPELAKLQTVRSQMTSILIGLQASFLAVTFLVSIFVSHKIAGPLYKLRRAFEDARGGNTSTKLRFRKGDHFQELADGYNEMMERFAGASAGKPPAQIGEAASHLEKALENPTSSRQDIERALAALNDLRRPSAPAR